VATPAVAAIHVREAGEADARGVAALLDVLGYPCTPEDAAGRIRQTAADADQRLLVADWHGELVGLLGLDFMYYLPLGATTCRITALAVSPEYRRLGTGRRLLREAEQRARQAGAARLELTTAAHRSEAHAFYQRCGFSSGALRFVKVLGTA
jgi:GNAT superfamily N-acetyltransferase